jgi:uroporphyrinogen decarboxylase
MRQAGRIMPKFRRLYDKLGFMKMILDPDLCAEVTVMPVDEFGVDAAILFSDMLNPVVPMGIKLVYEVGKGPKYEPLIRNKAEVSRLRVPDAGEDLAYVMKSIKLASKALRNKVPLIGFSGAPFTVAGYMIEGGQSLRYFHLKRLMFEDPETFHALMEKLTAFTCDYVTAQVKAGVNAVMLFENWAAVLNQQDYAELALPYVRRVVASLRKAGDTKPVPVIVFVNGFSALVDQVKAMGADVIGIDYRVNLDRAVKQLGPRFAVQGNLDPFCLFMSPRAMEKRVGDVLAMGAKAPGFIFNLGETVQQETPFERVVGLVETVHRLGKK